MEELAGIHDAIRSFSYLHANMLIKSPFIYITGNREKNVYFEDWRKSDDKLPGQHFVGWRPEKAAHNRSIYVGLKAGREAAQAREEALKTLENGADDESTPHSPSVLQDSSK